MTEMEKIQNLREQTGLGLMDLKKALSEVGGDEQKVLEVLKKRGVDIAQKRALRSTDNGVVASYVHTGRIGALVALQCETDFVAKTDEFRELAKDIAMQIASMNPESRDELMHQDFIKDSNKTVQDVVTAVIAKTGENIQVGNFSRIDL